MPVAPGPRQPRNRRRQRDRHVYMRGAESAPGNQKTDQAQLQETRNRVRDKSLPHLQMGKVHPAGKLAEYKHSKKAGENSHQVAEFDSLGPPEFHAEYSQRQNTNEGQRHLLQKNASAVTALTLTIERRIDNVVRRGDNGGEHVIHRYNDGPREHIEPEFGLTANASHRQACDKVGRAYDCLVRQRNAPVT